MFLYKHRKTQCFQAEFDRESCHFAGFSSEVIENSEFK